MSTDEYVPDEEQVRAWCRDGTGDYPDVMDEWLDRFLARVRRAVAIYQRRAREAEAEARAQRHRADDMEDNALRAQTNLRAAEERADKAEQRLAAWMDECRRATHTGAVNEMMAILEHDDHTLRDGSPTRECGRGPCCLGDGHEGNCRT